MACIVDTKSKRRRSAKLAAGLLSAIFVIGTFAGSASAQERGRGDRDYYHNWNGGYYPAPPVVYGSPYGSSYYGSPYYYPPPVVYGPGIGFNIQIR